MVNFVLPVKLFDHGQSPQSHRPPCPSRQINVNSVVNRNNAFKINCLVCLIFLVPKSAHFEQQIPPAGLVNVCPIQI